MHANYFLRCANCGTEFRSVFAGAISAIGCVEACPKCGAVIQTPMVLGGLNVQMLERAQATLMVRPYGEGGSDGYVFMGNGELAFEIRSPTLLPVHAAYDRNIRRALDLLELLYEAGKEREQLLLGTIYMAIMTAYECLTDDLLNALQRTRLAPSLKGRPPLHERRTALFKAVGLQTGGQDTVLRYLYALRNCLTHSAGVVDEDFHANLKKIGSAPPHLAAYSLGEPLVLEAREATYYADTLQHLAHELFRAAQVRCQASKR